MKYKNIIVLNNNMRVGVVKLPQWIVSLTNIMYLLCLVVIVGMCGLMFYIDSWILGSIFLYVIYDYTRPLFSKIGLQGFFNNENLGD